MDHASKRPNATENGKNVSVLTNPLALPLALPCILSVAMKEGNHRSKYFPQNTALAHAMEHTKSRIYMYYPKRRQFPWLLMATAQDTCDRLPRLEQVPQAL